MNPIVKGVLIFATGVAAGCAGGYFYAKGKYQKRAQDDIQAFIDDFNRKWKKDDEDAERALKDIVSANSTQIAVKTSQNASTSSFKAPTSANVDYSGYSSTKLEKGQEEALKREIELSSEHPVDSDEDDGMGENEIVGDEYADKLPPFWHETECEYYMDSDTLVDSESRKVMDIHNTVTRKCLEEGHDWLEQHGLTDRDFIFVNSPKNQCTYIVYYTVGALNEEDVAYDDDGGEKESED